MKSAKIDAFLSASFSDSDKDIYELVDAISLGIDIKCVNVDKGYSAVPPEVARRLITESPLLIGIITKRDETKAGKYHMPSAVREEISMAYGLRKPSLLISEKGIELDGFMKNFGTHLVFDRGNLYEKQFLEKLISSMHCAKMDVLSNHELILAQGIEEFYAEYIKGLYELKKTDSGYIWEYASTKKMVFNQEYKKEIITGAWATTDIAIPEDADDMLLSVEIDDANKDFAPKLDIVRKQPNLVEATLRFEPAPEKGDHIEYTTYTSSKYLNPIFSEDLEIQTPIEIEDTPFLCWDGFVPINRTKVAKFQFRIPKSYGVKEADFKYFAGSYTNALNYIVESEIKRSVVKSETYGGNIEITFEIESPLVGHVYGFAWNPPSRG